MVDENSMAYVKYLLSRNPRQESHARIFFSLVFLTHVVHGSILDLHVLLPKPHARMDATALFTLLKSMCPGST